MRIGELQKFFEGQEHVRLAYLFGSSARGKVGPLSDVDVAVLVDEQLNRSERSDLRLKLINGVSSILKTDKLDVVLMNEAPVTLNHEVIKSGRVLDVKDVEERVKVESKILSKYLDRIYYERRSLNEFLERVLKKGGL